MKKATFIVLPFSLANAALFSLGMSCLLHLLSLAMAISLDSSAQHPRFIPFCIVLGTLAFLGFIAMLILSAKISEKYSLTKSVWILAYVFAFILSIPMLKLWEMLFDFLQKTV